MFLGAGLYKVATSQAVWRGSIIILSFTVRKALIYCYKTITYKAFIY